MQRHPHCHVPAVRVAGSSRPTSTASPNPRSPAPSLEAPAPQRPLDVESRSWLERLRGTEPARGFAVAELHERLRREAAFHIRNRVRTRSEFPNSDIGDLATEAADDALVVLMRKLDDYRGEGRFWTWPKKFAALEALVSIRRRIGPDRVGTSPDPGLAPDVPDPAPSAQELLETYELPRRVEDIVATQLTTRQRTALIATAVDGVSPKALAGELHTTPGAVRKSVHDARAKLKLNLAAEMKAPPPALRGLGRGDAGVVHTSFRDRRRCRTRPSSRGGTS